ncbi:MAG: InlB B-repeat-containing protein, partial [Bacteroidales bacterium]|nr:InlB B-repeat-containing protein [Bacteroidales bacterium]
MKEQTTPEYCEYNSHIISKLQQLGIRFASLVSIIILLLFAAQNAQGQSLLGMEIPEIFVWLSTDGKTLTFTFEKKSSVQGTKYELNTGENTPGWVSDGSNKNITKVVFNAAFYAAAKPTSCYYWFYGFENLTEIEHLDFLNTSEVTTMEGMFFHCLKLKSLNLSTFNTEKVTNMHSMFEMRYDKNELENLDVSSFNTAKVTTMDQMFVGCDKLKSLDVSKFNTAEVTNMHSMFYYCKSLEKLDVSNFDTKKVKDMHAMFDMCCSLESLDVSNFNTENVETTQQMFIGCSNLKSLDVSNFDTKKVNNMELMFEDCSSLESLNLSGFDIRSLVYIQRMFSGCSNLTYLDISDFDMSGFNFTNNSSHGYKGLFKNCTNLTTIIVGNGWSITDFDSDDMFLDSPELIGGQGTTYTDANPTDKTYAHVDGGTANPGYLTHKGDPFVILYDLDDGTNAASNPASFPCNLTENITLAEPTKEGYEFIGWTGSKITGLTEPTKNVVIPAGSIGNRKYVANWKKKIPKINVGAGVLIPTMTEVKDNYDYDKKNRVTTSFTVYYGTDEAKNWLVIGNNGTGAVQIANTVTLFASDVLIDNQEYDDKIPSLNSYANSKIKSVVDALYDNKETTNGLPLTLFSDEERSAIDIRSLAYGEYSSDRSNYCDGVSDGNGTSGYLWLLSTKEADLVGYNFRAIGNYSWWLRSPGDLAMRAANVISPYSILNYSGVNVGSCSNDCVRPAFNLNLSSIIFTSTAVGGKSSGTVGASALTPIGDYTGDEWKLTIKDANRSGFTASLTKGANGVGVGENVTISYSGALTGENEYVSALLANESGKPLYYGRIINNSASGEADITMPQDIAVGNYTLYIFSEQYNGDKKTDFASLPVQISIRVKQIATVAPTLTTTDETIAGKADGKINGLTTEMEISTTSATSGYAAVTDANITNDFAPGTYYVRYAESANYTVSPATTVTIGAGRQLVVTFICDVATYSPVETTYNTTISAPTDDPEKDGYTFTGWYDGSVKFDFENTKITEDKDLSAGWQPIKYTITYNLNGGALKQGENNPQEYTIESDDITLYNPEKEGYTFSGWNDGTKTAATVTIAKGSTGNRSYTAVYEPVKYKITFDTDGAGAIDPIEAEYQSAITAPKDPVKEGYTFTGWEPQIPATMPLDGLTVKAQWKKNQYTLKFMTDETTVYKQFALDFGAAVAAPADPDKYGFTFGGWQPEVPQTMPANDLIVNAIWLAQGQYVIRFITQGGTVIDPIVGFAGDAVTPPADPTREGYTFMGWDKPVPTVMPEANTEITALWKAISYTVTYNTGNGSEPVTVSYDFGAAIATPQQPTREGYTFDGWDATIPATMPAANLTFNALWKINQYTLTFMADEATVYKQFTQDFGTEISAPQNPQRDGYIFGGWDKPVPTTMPAENVTLTAQWAQGEYTITFMTDETTVYKVVAQDFGTAVTAPADPVRSGYIFLGWDKAVPTTMPAENITLTAKWQKAAITVAEQTIEADTRNEYFCNGYAVAAFTVTAGNPTKYTIEFAEGGIENATGSLTGSSVEIPLPKGLSAGTYTGTLQLADAEGNASPRIPLTLTVSLPFYTIVPLYVDVAAVN